MDFMNLPLSNSTMIDKQTTIILFIFSFLYAFLFIMSLVWFIYLTLKLSILRNEVFQKIVTVANDVVYMQTQNAAAEAAALVYPPAYNQIDMC
ncbi:small hydrophobic protein [Jingmen Apodemus agrarius jeilongvirus 1]|uniref:SH protein n=2 Tax=unclassified Jeilongvirus TaxID=2686069 RepID=A0A8F7CGH0_9MONO|nr:SH protein [Jeilongvirus sp.]UBB42279.1 small hydrophobic protein [Wenzhou Apodemus agrarius jeilongvirus 1]UBB42319.1 small hydrophobic protein [Jingmen Apodemus agrarius jeilongvirus 1]WIU81503.1 small hydrophobic protein [Apodemus agrarius jeilongvirus]WPV62450.1 MAG: small hydrophobic protein [Jingmen rodent jeilongvirus 1]